ncbi:hypothetical protein [Paenibacillus larvae]|uniref:Uncharacterized protein n=1 Tax=Paenibacillus larvae subsp. larvae TaxID=147375 RepID=A0A6C0QQA7_9BACL|nr:hypothetical protein [Paenibacillus larvae]QHZ50872.1 hypothetical protein ERICV_01717 [Paenibacillus larvae subsp. larvae]
MIYANVLSDAVIKSGWTYSKIIEKCRARGVCFSRSYLSKICTGVLPPPSDRINKVLAEVLSPVSELTYQQLALAKYKQIIPADILEAIASGQ